MIVMHIAYAHMGGFFFTKSCYCCLAACTWCDGVVAVFVCICVSVCVYVGRGRGERERREERREDGR